MMMLMALEALSSADCKCRVQWWWSSRYETFLPTRVRMMDDGRRSEKEEGGPGGWNNFPPWPGNHNLPRRPLSPETLTSHTLTADREEDLKRNISWALGLGRVKLSCPYHFFHSIHWWTYQSQLKTGAKKRQTKELSAWIVRYASAIWHSLMDSSVSFYHAPFFYTPKGSEFIFLKTKLDKKWGAKIRKMSFFCPNYCLPTLAP